jgi:hypothetical protein
MYGSLGAAVRQVSRTERSRARCLGPLTPAEIRGALCASAGRCAQETTSLDGTRRDPVP